MQMPEPRGALVHPDVARDMATQPPAPPEAHAPPQPFAAPPIPRVGPWPLRRARCIPRRVVPSAAAGQRCGGLPRAAGAGPQTPAPPFDRRRATFIAGIADALVVAIVGGILVMTHVNSRVFGPEGVAQEYFSALSDGDAQAALELADVDVPAEQPTLLTNEVLSAAQAAARRCLRRRVHRGIRQRDRGREL